MNDLHPINRTLLTMLDNQRDRTAAAYENMRDETLNAEVEGDCNTILGITRHLLQLRHLMLRILRSPHAEEVADPNGISTVEAFTDAIGEADDLLANAIRGYDPEDWYTKPTSPREGIWGDLPTIDRFVRPFNDFSNHLGAVRAIRRMKRNPAERTQ